MKHNMILSASGWRKVFALSGDEQDKNPLISEEDKALSVIAANVFCEYLKNFALTIIKDLMKRLKENILQ